MSKKKVTLVALAALLLFGAGVGIGRFIRPQPVSIEHKEKVKEASGEKSGSVSSKQEEVKTAKKEEQSTLIAKKDKTKTRKHIKKTKLPDGTVITDTVIDQIADVDISKQDDKKSEEKKEERKSEVLIKYVDRWHTKEVEKQTSTIFYKPKWLVGVDVGAPVTKLPDLVLGSKGFTVGASVDRRIFGSSVFVGVRATTGGTVSISVRKEF